VPVYLFFGFHLVSTLMAIERGVTFSPSVQATFRTGKLSLSLAFSFRLGFIVNDLDISNITT